ncbi:variable surface lipoprotein [Mycoplasma struthionis]|uniref:Variable surface lipoprotein n=1 Tax=Mycoplasma struthionis TaxID=538220 RepID=A0A3G8LI24_9MOLU|nr:variable surface lipoprotein [Mycoplasma struthionis]AZG68520.1 hypothetical protein EGN60_00835 [Mycoplasma struthionis]
MFKKILLTSISTLSIPFLTISCKQEIKKTQNNSAENNIINIASINSTKLLINRQLITFKDNLDNLEKNIMIKLICKDSKMFIQMLKT